MNPVSARTGRILGTVALAAVMTVAGATPTWSAEPAPGARDTSRFACPPDQVPPSGFTDTQGNTFQAQIECLAWYGITQGGAGGRPANEYAPRASVQRDQMATFIARALDYVDPNLLPPYTGNNRFTDVRDDNVHVEAINRLADAGIVSGGVGGSPATTYSPGFAVQRDQMASFIARTIRFIFETDICRNVKDYFDDDNGNVHEPCINGLTDMGVVQGVSLGVYQTTRAVTRDQMSAFIMRAMDFLVEQELASTPD